jgi:hypothetical protein
MKLWGKIMSGFLRTGQRRRLERVQVLDIVSAFAREQEIATLLREQDPFLCDDPCPMNAGAPHRPIPSCGDIVCCHCAKVF